LIVFVKKDNVFVVESKVGTKNDWFPLNFWKSFCGILMRFVILGPNGLSPYIGDRPRIFEDLFINFEYFSKSQGFEIDVQVFFT
jgi:hypothetical protein